MHTVDVDCSFAYTVHSPSEFIFQLHAAHHPWQTILTESLTVSSHIHHVEDYEDEKKTE